jgi:hypothetical protein
MKQTMMAVCVTASVLLSGAASAQTSAAEAPLGLTWGDTSAKVKETGAGLADVPGTTFGTSFMASGLPRALSDQMGAILSFGHNDRLWRIVIISKKFENDPYGNQVKSRYEELKQILEEKYGRSKPVERVGDSIYREPRYFIAGIRGGQSYWYTDIANERIEIQLGIVASDSDTAQWRIIFEDRSLRRGFEGSKRANEKKAL